jgi:hypothetical protein
VNARRAGTGLPQTHEDTPMASVHQSPTTIKHQDATTWPSWTDQVEIDATWELGPGEDDAPPDPGAWAEHCAATRADDAPAAPIDTAAIVRAVEWLRGQEAYHAFRSEDGHDVSGIVRTAIADVRIVLDGSGARTPGDLQGMPGTRYRSVVLSEVAVPQEERRTRLAEALDGHADYYLALETDLGRLVAFEILTHAETAERMGSQTAGQYYDDEAAYLAALETFAGERDYPGVGW